jgi:hypothetical protein
VWLTRFMPTSRRRPCDAARQRTPALQARSAEANPGELGVTRRTWAGGGVGGGGPGRGWNRKVQVPTCACTGACPAAASRSSYEVVSSSDSPLRAKVAGTPARGGGTPRLGGHRHVEQNRCGPPTPHAKPLGWASPSSTLWACVTVGPATSPVPSVPQIQTPGSSVEREKPPRRTRRLLRKGYLRPSLPYPE